MQYIETGHLTNGTEHLSPRCQLLLCAFSECWILATEELASTSSQNRRKKLWAARSGALQQKDFGASKNTSLACATTENISSCFPRAVYLELYGIWHVNMAQQCLTSSFRCMNDIICGWHFKYLHIGTSNCCSTDFFLSNCLFIPLWEEEKTSFTTLEAWCKHSVPD